MNRRIAIALACAVACALASRFVVRASETESGNWTMRRSEDPGKVYFGLIQHRHNGQSQHESDWPIAAFSGLDIAKPGRQDVHFTIARDAGRFDCEGYLNNGEGAGVFHFAPDAKYSTEMKALGFNDVDDDKQYVMAVMDVSLAFAKEMKGEHLEDLDTDKLIAFRIFGVSHEFIAELRKAGLSATDSDKLVAFRIHGVTPEMVQQLHDAGYKPDEDTLIAMRIHGATPEWMNQLKKDGYDHVDLDQLIAFRIHGVSPEFIEKLQKLGLFASRSRPTRRDANSRRDAGVSLPRCGRVDCRISASINWWRCGFTGWTEAVFSACLCLW